MSTSTTFYCDLCNDEIEGNERFECDYDDRADIHFHDKCWEEGAAKEQERQRKKWEQSRQLAQELQARREAEASGVGANGTQP
jgi:hypothetical protein